MMKIVTTWLLMSLMLAQGLLPRTSLDLLRSPEVMKHYKEHQQQEKQPLGFIDFLLMHYSADSEHTKEKKHHLPFFDFSGIAGVFVLPSAVIAFETPLVILFLQKANFEWLNAYAFLSLRALICPPRA